MLGKLRSLTQPEPDGLLGAWFLAAMCQVYNCPMNLPPLLLIPDVSKWYLGENERLTSLLRLPILAA